MNVEKAERKLREAKFFLDKMRDRERLAFGDKETFDFYLSAFLNAGPPSGTRFMFSKIASAIVQLRLGKRLGKMVSRRAITPFIILWARIDVPKSITGVRLVA